MKPKRFEKIHLIAQGISGKVHKAFDNETKKIVALKSFPDSSEATGTILKSIQKEFKILQNIKSDYFVKVFELTETEQKSPLIVMEFIEGSPLKIALELNPLLSLKEIFFQVVNSLTELEKIKITHGDLKSDNILVVGNCVKIIDFGFAQTITEKLNSA
ncbi:protein kinase, partial [bacterium]|nr:protein kinase [bacterium]